MAKSKKVVCLKRDVWIRHAIETRERFCVLEEIKYFLGLCSTESLIELLPQVACKSEEEILKTPFVEMEVDEEKFDPENAGFTICTEKPIGEVHRL